MTSTINAALLVPTSSPLDSLFSFPLASEILVYLCLDNLQLFNELMELNDAMLIMLIGPVTRVGLSIPQGAALSTSLSISHQTFYNINTPLKSRTSLALYGKQEVCCPRLTTIVSLAFRSITGFALLFHSRCSAVFYNEQPFARSSTRSA